MSCADGVKESFTGCFEGLGDFVENICRDRGVQNWTKLDEKYRKNFGKERPHIHHIVVLMLENRTCDGLMGDKLNSRYNDPNDPLQRSRWDKDGKDLFSYVNKVRKDGKVVSCPVWTVGLDDPDMHSEKYMSVPSHPAGPVEKFHFLNKAVYEKEENDGRLTKEDLEKGPTMGGFAQQYYTKEMANPCPTAEPGVAATDFDSDPPRSPAMYVYRQEQLKVVNGLMDNYGCSDCHFSSAPCQTWPNRLFASSATAYGYYNNLPYVNPHGEDELTYYQSEDVDKLNSLKKMMSSYDTDTVFHRLEDAGVSWGIYHGQASLAVLTSSLKYHFSIHNRVKTLEDFHDDVMDNNLPNYVWLEPNYDPFGEVPPNDMHPPANVLHGEKLIRDVYVTLRSNEDLFRKTLFIVTCDEGVGSFDHVKPPAAQDPVVGHDHSYEGFQADGSPYEMAENPFERFGTRVPNLLISPHIEPGTVVRPPEDSQYPFDHTSIIRTAFDLFLGDPSVHLTERDKVAPSFTHALTLGLNQQKKKGFKDFMQRARSKINAHKRKFKIGEAGQEKASQIYKNLNWGPELLSCANLDDEPSGIQSGHKCHSVNHLLSIIKDRAELQHQLTSDFKNKLIALIGL